MYRRTESNRRHFLAALSAGGAFFLQPGAFAQALLLTPAQTEGPYYPNRLPLDQDNDLLIINDNITPALGTVAWLSGRILDRNGAPIRGALVEVWQADNRGSYIHTQGALNGGRDGNFQGYGRFQTASDGRYLFRTIKPGLYPGRSRHIHAKISLPGGRSLTTQLYVEGETGNDSVLNRVPASQRSAVIRPWVPAPASAVGALSVNWDVVMNFTPSTNPATSRPTLVSMAGVTHGATLESGIASGSWVTLFGTGLAPTTRIWNAGDIVDGRLPESLDGVSVSINNRPASIYYISPTQLNVLAPEATAEGNVPVTVSTSAGTSAAITVNFRRLSPGLFQFPSENAAAVRADGTLIGPANLIAGATTVPARPGDTILLFGTGFGPTRPSVLPNETFSVPLPTTNSVRVQIHNQLAPVAFAGLVSPGLYQFNVTVPDLPDGDYPVSAEVAGVRTSRALKLRLEQGTNAVSHPPAAPFRAEEILKFTVA